MILSELPDDILIEIGKIIKGPPPYDAHCSQFNKFHQSCKLISLGSTCKAIRIALASLLFCCIEIGFRDEAKFSIKPQLDRMMESPYILKHVRHVQLVNYQVKDLKTITKALSKMPNLIKYQHSGASPVPTMIAEVICGLSNFKCLFLDIYGVESLPSFASLKDLQYLSINADLLGLLEPELLPFAPITVAADRRLGNGNRRRGTVPDATISEQQAALAKGLVPILAKSALTLEGLEILPERDDTWLDQLNSLLALNREKLVLPNLKRLQLACDISCAAFRRLLKNATELEHLCLMSRSPRRLSPPSIKYPCMKSFHYLFDDYLEVAAQVNNWLTAAENLTSLELNGLKHDETSFIFKPSLVCGPNLDDLTVYYMSSDAIDGVSKRGLQSIFYACPNIRSLAILSKAWGVHMTEVIDLIVQELPLLEYFKHNHRWAYPRTHNLLDPNPDGKSIRWAKMEGVTLARSLGGYGPKFQKEMTKRIKADIKAVTPLYAKKITDWAERSKNLNVLYWEASPEVKWIWTIEREGGKISKIEQNVGVAVSAYDD